MKFKEGNLVEVLRRGNEPCGSWFLGKIVSADGDSYIVRYKLLVDTNGARIIEKVPKEDVRPQPPHEKAKRWMIGDIAEVFDVCSWRVGTMAEVSKNNRVIIRLFGSTQVKEFHEANLRIRQVWHNNKWSVIGKVGRNKQNPFAQVDSKFGPSLDKVQKRSCEETCSREKEKKKDLMKDRRGHFKTAVPRGNTERNYAFCHKSSSSKDLFIGGNYKKRKSSLAADRCENSDQCSVASCSSNEFMDHPVQNSPKPLEHTSGSSDNESSFRFTSEENHLGQSLGNKLEVDIHKLELNAYKSTVQALYVSGPLSWEQESLLTNLRLFLHISNEEHLLQLRYLLSTQVH